MENPKIVRLKKFLTTREEGRKSHIQFPEELQSQEPIGLDPDVVIAEAFNQLQDVVIGGIDKSGKWWFSTSLVKEADIVWILENFKMAVIDASPERESNMGRDV